jgi:hypothetical protein
MKNKIIVALVLIFSINCGILSQEIERLTFFELKPDGTIVGTVTVDAIFVGWEQHKISHEGGFQVTRISTNFTGEWSPWELGRREPANASSIRQLHDVLLRELTRNPRSSVRIQHRSGIQVVRIAIIRSGSSSQRWWSEDGRSFNILYEVWAIGP